MAPQTMKQWTVEGTNGFEALKINANAPVPKVGEKDVLVKIQAVSLNYRDLIIPKGQYPFPQKNGVIPGSDGAGTIEAVGPRVTRFAVGDKVTTLFNQGHIGGAITPDAMGTALGGARDGCLREYAVFDEATLVKAPSNLSIQEASTLPCAALTAWNALFGLESKALKPGQTVLTQGTGGVSIFALQFAKATGAQVISTTSSADKAETLKKLGADHVINYKEDASWGETAKKLSTGGLGADHIIEVGGPNTMAQSLKAVKLEGIISVIGFLGGKKEVEGGPRQPSTLECLTSLCTVRGIFVGSRLQLEAMSAAVETANIKPVVDSRVFKLDELYEAYQYQWDQKHFGKVVVTLE